MEETKINIALPEGPASENPHKIIIMEARAQDEKDTRKIFTERVTIDAIPVFIAGRNWPDKIADNKAVIVYCMDPNNLSIDLHTDPEHTEAITLLSRLKKDKDIEAFAINKDRYFSQKELINIIKKSAHLFPTIEEAKALIASLRNFQAKFESEVERLDDRKGNKSEAIRQSLKVSKGEIPQSFLISAPLFERQEKVKLNLEIEIEADGPNPTYAFYCLGLDQLYQEKGEEYIKKVVDPLANRFVCIEKQL